MSENDGEWGPWIEHDGKGCPVDAGFVVLVDTDPYHMIGIGRYYEFKISNANKDWVGWTLPIRYRIRKPRALLDMIERARELDKLGELECM